MSKAINIIKNVTINSAAMDETFLTEMAIVWLNAFCIEYFYYK